MMQRADDDRPSSSDEPLQVVILIFQNFDQLDATGPFEVFAQARNVKVTLAAKDLTPVRDVRGLVLLPDATLTDTQRADVLVVPGGAGQESLMDDEVVLHWLRQLAGQAKVVLSVCTGALILGAAGLLQGRRATTHWASHELLALFGAEPVNERVVVDGALVTTAGVSAGIDGALRTVAELWGEEVARAIQLGMEYAPEPPFAGGTPETTPVAVRAPVEDAIAPLRARRRATAERVAARLTSIRAPGS